MVPTARLLAKARIIVNSGLQMRNDDQVLIFSPQLLKAARGRFPPILYGALEGLFRYSRRLVAKPHPEAAVFGHGGIDPTVLQGDKHGHRL